MVEFKLVTIRIITDIQLIPNADLIEVAYIDGWPVVVKKNEFKIGDSCIFCEIDSWIPTEIAEFLSKGKEPKEYLGVKGERLLD
jgi:RNA ligase (TIGR02306 family)